MDCSPQVSPSIIETGTSWIATLYRRHRCELSQKQRARDESQVYEVWVGTARPGLASFLSFGSPEQRVTFTSADDGLTAAMAVEEQYSVFFFFYGSVYRFASGRSQLLKHCVTLPDYKRINRVYPYLCIYREHRRRLTAQPERPQEPEPIQERLSKETEEDAADWTNTEEPLGTNHYYIVEIEISLTLQKRFIKKQELTDRDAFREMHLKSNPSPRNCDFEEWAPDLCKDANRYTKHVCLTTTVPEVDARLLHLWEARRGLLKRRRRQKLNRKLKIKIS
ncbi:hypothetical protein HPB47_007222 [Ixodes persulcatus]|uniref:Uncharacterized protein n=1 Tax=Ixodes persulcatus TaxID=34615 RepID=A0AC60P8G5_IXOPE|nr:hypothetical protein HPB47_007222 [Ixodes persulcatus]